MYSAGRRPLKPTEKGGTELLTSLASKWSHSDLLASIISGNSASATWKPAAKKARSSTNVVGASAESVPDIVKAQSVIQSGDVPASNVASDPSAMSTAVGREDLNDNGPNDSGLNDSEPEIVEEDPEAEMSKIRLC